MLQSKNKVLWQKRLNGFVAKLGQGKAFANIEKSKPWLRITFTLTIMAYLVYKLSAIGWGPILKSLPTNPGFYLLAIAFVMLPILTEKFVFPMATKSNAVPPLNIFIRRHVLNKAVMNYAGEGYFLGQISKSPKASLIDAAIIVKNLALARTFAANFWIIIMVLAAMTFGRADVMSKIVVVSPQLAIAVSLLSLGFCLGSVVFYKKLTKLDFGTAVQIASFYLIRSLLAASILMAQWALVLPGTAITVWFLFLIIFFIAKKSPIGGDLVFVSVALTLPGLGADSAAIAAMLLTQAVVLQIIYLIGFIFTSKISSKTKTNRSLRDIFDVQPKAH